LKEIVFDRRRDRVFKESFWPHLLMTFLLGGLSIGIGIGLLLQKLPLFFLLSLFGLIFMMVVFLTRLIKACRRTNWLMVATSEGLLIKFRSFDNCHLQDRGPQVISIPFYEIAAVRRVKETSQMYSGLQHHHQGPSTYYKTYLEILLAVETDEEIQKGLSRESRIRESVTSLHYPVSMPNKQTLKLEWSSYQSKVAPGIKHALDLFSQRQIRILDPNAIEEDYTRYESWDQEHLNHRLKKLLEQGHTMEANILARKALGLDSTQSHKFIEDLRKK
jgi:hypothetical protein